MFCPNCGMPNPDQAAFCTNCRAEMATAGVAKPSSPLYTPAPASPVVAPSEPPVVPYRPEPSTVRTLLGILAFCLPPAGLLMYFSGRVARPRQARRLLNISVFSLAFWLFLYILMILISLTTQVSYSY